MITHSPGINTSVTSEADPHRMALPLSSMFESSSGLLQKENQNRNSIMSLFICFVSILSLALSNSLPQGFCASALRKEPKQHYLLFSSGIKP